MTYCAQMTVESIQATHIVYRYISFSYEMQLTTEHS